MTNKLQIVEDEIGRHLDHSRASGELEKANGYGKPLVFADGYHETPDEVRMGFKILKDAGCVPPEVELMKQIAQLRKDLSLNLDQTNQVRLLERLSYLEISLSLAKGRGFF
jgi:hypothetical protein